MNLICFFFCKTSPLQINSLSLFCLFSSLRHERAQAVCGQRAEPVWYGPHGASGSPLPQDRGELGQATRHRLASFSVGCVAVCCAALEAARSRLLFLMWLRVDDFETVERNLWIHSYSYLRLVLMNCSERKGHWRDAEGHSMLPQPAPLLCWTCYFNREGTFIVSFNSVWNILS